MNPRALPPLIGAVFFLLLGLGVFCKNRSSAINRIYALACLSTFWWQFSWFALFAFGTEKLAGVMVRVGYTGITFIPIFFFHFFVQLLKSKKDRLPIIGSYAAGSIFLFYLWTSDLYIKGYYKYSWGFYPRAGAIHFLYLIMLSLLSLRMFFLLRRGLYKERFNKLRHNQIKYMLLALCAYVPASVDFVANYGIGLYPPGYLFILVSSAVMAYAIVAYRLMDINVVIKNSALVIGTFIASLFSSNLAFQLFYNTFRMKVATSYVVASSIGFAAFLFLIWRMNESIFKKEEKYHMSLTYTSIDMVKNYNPGILAREIVETSYEVIGVKRALSYLLNRRSGVYELQALEGMDVRHARQKFYKEDPIVVWYNRIKSSLVKKQILKEADVEILEYSLVCCWLEDKDFLSKDRDLHVFLPRIKLQMEELGADIVVPSIYRNTLLGFLLLGEKRRGIYSQKDKEVLADLARYATMAIRNVLQIQDRRRKSRERARLILRLRDSYQELQNAHRVQRDTFFDIADAFSTAVQIKDPCFTIGHIKRTRDYVPMLVRKLEEDGVFLGERRDGVMEQMDLLLIAATLHDAGKIFVPKEILNKPERLTPEEYGVIQKHTIWGADIFQKIEGLKGASEWIRHHHERHDGTGYPDGLKGDDIPLQAKIIAVADAYDAMTGQRPYRNDPMPKETALEELKRCSGTQFDPRVVRAMMELYRDGRL